MSSFALPDAAETAAYAAAVGGALRVLVNRPRAGVTEQLRLRAGSGIEALAPLPLVAAGAAACGGTLLVTGSDGAGAPLVAGVAEDGRVAWRVGLPGPLPTRWPLPGCAPGPSLAWQTRRETLEVAAVGPEGIGDVRFLPVGGPPLELSMGGGAVWAAWPEPGGVRLAALRGSGVESILLPSAFPSHAAVGALEGGGAAVAWTEARGTFLARVGPGAGPPAALDPGPAAGGRLAVVPGPEPLVWVRRREASEGEEPVSVSALVLPGRAPVLVHEPVFAVAWWGRRIAAVCAREVRLFDPEGA
jgi:hypothetical protein